MAIEWSKKVNNCHYEVRSAGATRRLYTNKVFHSQYNPNKVIQGGIWDLLYLPAFSYPQSTIKRVLVLGVGGGTILQQIKKYLKPDSITGIELNPVHLYVAQNYFALKHSGIKLIKDDAISWLTNYKGEKFDLIIDDLFGHHNGEADRVIKVNQQWANKLLNQLNPEGMLTINFGSNNELKNSALLSYKKIYKQLSSVLRLTLPDYENAIGVFSRVRFEQRKIRENFIKETSLSSKSKLKNLNYKVKVYK